MGIGQSIHHQTFRQRAPIMGAGRADGEEVVRPISNRSSPNACPRSISPSAPNVDFAALFEIRTFKVLRCLSHKIPLFKIRIALEQYNARSDLLTFARFKIKPETLKIIREQPTDCEKRQDSTMRCPATHLLLFWA